MEFIDGGWYKLPDGQRVQAQRSQTITPVWRFVNEDGLPAYIYADSPDEDVRAFKQDPTTKNYHAVPCSVKLTDFQLVAPEHQ